MDAGEQEEESSSKRRERLLALRSAASASASSSPSAAPPPLPPAAALDLPEPDLMASSTPRPPPRFDFYTNPGAAFSSAAAGPHKRKSAYSPAPAPAPAPAPSPPYGNYGNNPSLPHQHHMAPSPIHSPSPMPFGASGSSPWQSPMQFQTPTSGYRGTPPGPPPRWNPRSASPAQDYHPHPHSFGFGCSNVGRGASLMNYGPRGRPYSSSGQGRGRNYYSSPGSRGRGGRGDYCFQNRSGWQGQRNFYSKRMVDDPWQDLQPIVGNILIPMHGSKSWLPESLRAKKDTSDQAQIISKSGMSLAEYLDLSFNEASNVT